MILTRDPSQASKVKINAITDFM